MLTTLQELTNAKRGNVPRVSVLRRDGVQLLVDVAVGQLFVEQVESLRYPVDEPRSTGVKRLNRQR